MAETLVAMVIANLCEGGVELQVFAIAEHNNLYKSEIHTAKQPLMQTQRKWHTNLYKHM